MGSCGRLHVHDESLINTVGKFTCQPGKLYKSAMPKGIGKSMALFVLYKYTATRTQALNHILHEVDTFFKNVFDRSQQG